MCDVYKIFSKDWKNCSECNEGSMLELYLSESYGDVTCKPNNGFYIGKRYLNLTVSMWKEDIKRGLLSKKELYDDPQFPNWWLDKVLR